VIIDNQQEAKLHIRKSRFLRDYTRNIHLISRAHPPLTPDRDDDIVQLFSSISHSKYRELKEVISPTLTIKVVGFFLGGLKLYILNKMKYTNLKGQKNNMYSKIFLNKIDRNLSFKCTTSKSLYINKSIKFVYNQSLKNHRYYHINNIRSINRIGPHNEDVLSVIIGSLLGDAYGNKRTGEGVRICYRQSIRHKEYLFWLNTFFYNRGYTSNLQPRQYSRTIQSKEGKIYYGFEFNTFTFRSFNWIHKMFYKNGKKVIPLNICEYLTPLALAVWIMDDGGFVNSGIRIATNSYELKEVELLNDAIKSKFNLETTIQKIWIKNQYSIYIKKKSVNNLRNIVGPYIHTSMLYNLGNHIGSTNKY